MTQYYQPVSYVVAMIDGCINHIQYLHQSISNKDNEINEDIIKQIEEIFLQLKDLQNSIEYYKNDDDIQEKTEKLQYEIKNLQKISINRNKEIYSQIRDLNKMQKAWIVYNNS